MYQSPLAEYFAPYHMNQVLYKQLVRLTICFSQCLPLALLHPQVGNFFCLYFIFVVLGDSQGILVANGSKFPRNMLHSLRRLREYRSGLMNIPGAGIIKSLFMVRGLLGDNEISLITSLRDSSVLLS